jgi:hypothetical protein
MLRAWNNLVDRLTGFSVGERALSERPAQPAEAMRVAAA